MKHTAEWEIIFKSGGSAKGKTLLIFFFFFLVAGICLLLTWKVRHFSNAHFTVVEKFTTAMGPGSRYSGTMSVHNAEKIKYDPSQPIGIRLDRFHDLQLTGFVKPESGSGGTLTVEVWFTLNDAVSSPRFTIPDAGDGLQGALVTRQRLFNILF